jgi:ADP-ribose pyrophosphatase YjhB (NUDIX family)
MSEADLKNKDLYYVAVKLFLENDGQLFIFKDAWGDWDLPGGRIRKHEFETPIEDVIKRKMHEEVGEQVVYELGQPLVTMRHERIEQLAGEGENPRIRIFAVGYEADLLGGEPRIGDHHTEMKWVDIKTFKPEDYFTGGWLKGVQDYLEVKRSN